jgi:hypothetical protein
VRVSSDGWRRGQSAREGEAERNEARGMRGALAVLYEGSWARGRASWLRNPATCASAHALVHGGREEGGTDKAGPRRRESIGDVRGQWLGTGELDPRDRERERMGEGN